MVSVAIAIRVIIAAVERITVIIAWIPIVVAEVRRQPIVTRIIRHLMKVLISMHLMRVLISMWLGDRQCA
ncbi:MAG: hypothetical protein LUQ38_11110 [Methanotrichaceae archaeon]|nr:hypothetical protein [Methanotrichaceae archaeon]